jgi:pimeloyl-ACP methyl ester carboxylesterase
MLTTPHGKLFVRVWPQESDLAPIILFHDSIGSVELWRSFPASLAEATRRTVIAYDRLGFGKSDARVDRLPLDFVGAEARDTLPLLLDAFEIDDFIAMGHSVGGGMAIHAAADFPEDCVALITESAQGFIEERLLDGIRAAKAEFAKDGQVERLVKYHGDKARWVLDAWTETWLSPGFATWNLDAVLPLVTCPLLAIHGEDDEYGSPDHAERIASMVAGEASAVILPGHRHIPHREDEAAVVDLIAAFLDDIEE